MVLLGVFFMAFICGRRGERARQLVLSRVSVADRLTFFVLGEGFVGR